MARKVEELRVFTRVRISADGIPGCIGRIEDIRPIEELPDVDEMRAELPRSILAEWGVSRLAMISYYMFPDQQVMFADMGQRFFERNIRASLPAESTVNRSLERTFRSIVLDKKTSPPAFSFNHNL